MGVDWDPVKNRANCRKHGVRFEDARVVFEDPERIELLDDRDYVEERWAVIGMARGRVLYVIYVERGGIRIISGRKADPNDVADYYANKRWR